MKTITQQGELSPISVWISHYFLPDWLSHYSTWSENHTQKSATERADSDQTSLNQMRLHCMRAKTAVRSAIDAHAQTYIFSWPRGLICGSIASPKLWGRNKFRPIRCTSLYWWSQQHQTLSSGLRWQLCYRKWPKLGKKACNWCVFCLQKLCSL